MPDRRAPWQNIPTDVLDLQQRTDQAAAWAQEQRRQLAQSWADLHLQDAYSSLGHLLYQSPATQDAAPQVAPPEMATGPEGDRPASEFEQPSAFSPQAEDVAGGLTKSYTGQPDAVVSAPPEDQGLQSPDRPPFGMPAITPFGAVATLPPIVPPNVTPPDQGEQQRVQEGRSPIETGGELVGKTAGFLGRQLQSEPGVMGEGVVPDPEEVVRAQEARGGYGGGRLGGLVSGVGEAVGGGPGALEAGAEKAAGEVARLRLDKFPEAVRSTIEEAAQRGDFWQQQRRNVIPDAAAEKMADELGRTVEQFVASRPGKAFNTEETRALRNALTGKALEVDDLKTTAEALGDTASDALKRQLGQAQTELLALSRVAEGARAEAGRAFRAYITDTRGRLARAQAPEYTNVSTVPIRPAPELEGAVVQAGMTGPPEHRLGLRDAGPVPPELGGPVVQASQFGPPEHALGQRAPGPAAPDLGRGAEQSVLIDPLDYYRGPRDAGPHPGPLTAFGERAEQGTFVDPNDYYREPWYAGEQPGPLRTLGNDVTQGTLVDPNDYYRQPVDPGQRAAPAPGSSTPRLTEQAPLITEPVARSGIATNLLGQTRREGSGPRVYDRVSLVRMAGMLSGAPSHLVNAVGNLVMGGTSLLLKEGQVGADLARVGIGRALGKDVQRQRFQAEVGPQLLGYTRGLWAGAQQVPGILAHGVTEQQLGQIAGARRLASGSAAVDAVVEAPLRALAASDAVFRSASFGGHAAALATRQATQEGLSGAARTQRVQEILGNLSDHPGLLDSANKLAARDVFQEARLETDAITRLRGLHPGAEVVGDLALPFYKTPYNVAAQGAGMTTAGYGSALAAARRGETGEAVDRAVRATVGTAAMLYGLNLAGAGMVTGAYPTDPTDRSTLPEGWRPWSFRIPTPAGVVYVPLQAAGAWAVPLAVAASVTDAQKAGRTQGDPSKVVLGAVGAVGKFMVDMSAFQGINTLMNIVQDPTRYAERAAEGVTSSFVPASGFLRTVQQAAGEPARDPNNALEAMLAQVPGLSSLVPTAQTSLGADRSRGVSGPMALVVGSRVTPEQPSSVLAALRDADVGIPEPPTTVSRENVKDIPLTQAEQRAYRTRAGEELSRRVEKAIANPKWSQGSPADRKAFLEQQVRDARDKAEEAILASIGKDEIKRRLAARPAA